MRWHPSREIVLHALTSLIEALILHDRIAVGPESELGVIESGGIHDLGINVVRPERNLSPEARFWILSAARRASLNAVDDIPELVQILAGATRGKFERGQLHSHLAGISVSGSARSIHHIQHLIENDRFYAADMADRLEDRLDAGTFGQRGADVIEESDNAINIDMDRFQHVRRTDIGPFFAAYVLVRAMFYLLVADFRGQVYHGDHVRSAAVRAVLGATPRVPFTERVVREVELIEARRDEVINQAMRFEAFPLAMPLVANAVLQRAKTRRECLTIALEVRASAQARRFRRYCRVVDEAIHDGDRRRVERAIAELGRYGVRLSQSISGDSTKIDSTAVKELVTFASPLAAALVSVFRMPVADVIDQIRNRKFALLSEVRASQRGAAARQRFDDLWATLPPAPSASEWPRARDFRKRWGG